MKISRTLPKVDLDKCNGCRTCVKVCPTLAMQIKDKKASVDPQWCRSCNTCAERCPEHAIVMIDREKPVTAFVDWREYDWDAIDSLCRKAQLHPDWIICYCTATRAKEAAAAILAGASDPAAVSRLTGIRTGCSIECIQPVLRLLVAAGHEIEKAPGWQWYGVTATVWDIPAPVREKYGDRGYHFDDDEVLMDKVIKAP